LLEEMLPVLLGNIAPAYAENWMILFGPLLIMVVMFGRGGLIGLLDRWQMRRNANNDKRGA